MDDELSVDFRVGDLVRCTIPPLHSANVLGVILKHPSAHGIYYLVWCMGIEHFFIHSELTLLSRL